MARVKDPNKPKRGFLDGYKTYNPEVEGFGGAHEWKQAFKFRLGFEVAKEKVGGRSPRGILGVSLSATWAEIRYAYAKLASIFYPEQRADGFHGDKEKFLDIQAAYEVLQAEFGK